MGGLLGGGIGYYFGTETTDGIGDWLGSFWSDEQDKDKTKAPQGTSDSWFSGWFGGDEDTVAPLEPITSTNTQVNKTINQNVSMPVTVNNPTNNIDIEKALANGWAAVGHYTGTSLADEDI